MVTFKHTLERDRGLLLLIGDMAESIRRFCMLTLTRFEGETTLDPLIVNRKYVPGS